MIRHVGIAGILALLLSSLAMAAGSSLRLPGVTIGRHLETSAMVVLGDAAPEKGVEITIRSSDPKKLLVSKTPEDAGAASITVLARQGARMSPEFWLQGQESSGSIAYSAEAPGYDSATGTVTLFPSAIAIVGPFRAASVRYHLRGAANESHALLRAAGLGLAVRRRAGTRRRRFVQNRNREFESRRRQGRGSTDCLARRHQSCGRALPAFSRGRYQTRSQTTCRLLDPARFRGCHRDRQEAGNLYLDGTVCRPESGSQRRARSRTGCARRRAESHPDQCGSQPAVALRIGD